MVVDQNTPTDYDTAHSPAEPSMCIPQPAPVATCLSLSPLISDSKFRTMPTATAATISPIDKRTLMRSRLVFDNPHGVVFWNVGPVITPAHPQPLLSDGLGNLVRVRIHLAELRLVLGAVLNHEDAI